MLYRWMKVLCLMLVALTGVTSGNALAQTLHKGPIKIIIPFPPGEVVDLIARLLADDMAKDLGQPITIDNRPGASGLIGLQAAASAEPDGHTLVMGQLGNIVIAPIVNKWPLDVRARFEPVALAYTNFIMLVAAPDFKARSLRELIDYSKANPGVVRVGTVGPGSFPHLMFELLRKQSGFDYTHVPYKGSAQITPDLMASRIEVSSLGFSNGLTFSNDGRLRAIAISGRTRSPAAPNIPTMSETVPGLEMLGWFQIFAPKGTPPAMVDRLNAAVKRAMANPAIEKQISALYIEPAPGTPADFDRIWKSDYERFSNLVREFNIVPQ